MTLADDVKSMYKHTKDAYDAIEMLGSSVPNEKNLANLSLAIASLPVSTPPPDDVIGCYDFESHVQLDGNTIKGGSYMQVKLMPLQASYDFDYNPPTSGPGDFSSAFIVDAVIETIDGNIVRVTWPSDLTIGNRATMGIQHWGQPRTSRGLFALDTLALLAGNPLAVDSYTEILNTSYITPYYTQNPTTRQWETAGNLMEYATEHPFPLETS